MKKFLIFLLYLIPALAIAIFYIFFNQTEISIQTNLTSFEYSVNGDSYTCPDSSCSQIVKNGSLMVSVKKEGFISQDLKQDTSQSTTFAFQLKELPHLDEVSKPDLTSPYTIQEAGGNKVVYLQADGKEKAITSFGSLSSRSKVQASANGQFLLIRDSATSKNYLYDTVQKNKEVLKNTIFNQPRTNSQEVKLLNSGNILLANLDNQVLEINKQGDQVNSYSLAALDHIQELQDGSWLIINNTQGFQIATTESQIILEQLTAVIQNQDLEALSTHIYLHNPTTNSTQAIIDLEGDLDEYKLHYAIKNGQEKVYLEDQDQFFEIALSK